MGNLVEKDSFIIEDKLINIDDLGEFDSNKEGLDGE